MAKPIGKKPKRTGPAGSKQLSWLWGSDHVRETIAAGRWRVYELFVTQETYDLGKEFYDAKRGEGIELEIATAARLTELAKTTEHEGVVARVSKFPYLTLEEFETQFKSDQGGTSLLSDSVVVVLDRVQDSNKFGEILRCCESAGVLAVIVGEHCQALVTPQVFRSSHGAVNHFPIVKTPVLAIAAQKLKDLGFQLIAADGTSELNVGQASFAKPTALIIGSTAHGLEPVLLGLCDQRVSIPVQGKSKSIGSAVATGIILYELRRQQKNLARSAQ